jgi:small-conductance mechanosensitive channel
MNEFLTSLLSADRLLTLLRVGALLLLGIPLMNYLGGASKRIISKHFTPQQGMIVGKIVQYGGTAVIVITVFHQLGFSLAPLLGAAGIVGIAVGFASQTSVSNVISGIFLIAEEPFRVGDVVNIGDVTGYVLSVDILSIKLRTYDNRYVRIPNETIIKSQVTNMTRFPIRRLDVKLSVAYKEDVKKVRKLLLEVAYQNPLCLQEPAPLVIFSGFGDSSIDLLFAVWTNRENFLDLKNSIQEDVKEKFDEVGVEIPFPHLSLYSGLASEPFAVKVVDSGS